MAGYGVKPEVGHVLDDRYLLEKVIGEGGMGVVFAARHVELGEVVAVKVLHSSAAMDEENLERFLREARLAAKIKNEHVVRVIDVARGSLYASTDSSRPEGVRKKRNPTPPYIVMEFLDGFDLADLVRARGPLPAMEAVDYVLQACEAVVEAHMLGIVHRDLKPSNLQLTRRPDGTPLLKVLDFGISKTHDDEDSKLTTTRAVFGSPAYMSPEQIRSAKHVDARTDVWALAVVLFELITARLPFVGDSAAAILAAVAADPPLPLGMYAGLPVPPGLEQAVERCLVKDRERRVSGIPELSQVLAPFASASGLASVEAVKRIVFQRTHGSQNPAIQSGSVPPGYFDPSAGAQSGNQNPNPYASHALHPLSGRPPPSGAEIGRTDRGMVVASRRNLKSRVSIIAGVAIAVVAVTAVAGTWAVQRSRVNAAAHGTSSSAATSTAAAEPSASGTAVIAADTPPIMDPPPSPNTPPPSVPPRSNPHAKPAHAGHAGNAGGHPVSPPSVPSALPSSAAPKPSNGIDKDSRF